jgi:2-polyprenyl-3-methyl-5-hydroxy-6-metoxy-1,4-benzoquinol methylase
MASSLERIIPGQLDASSAEDQQTLTLHLQRYQFAAANLKPGIIADLACGVGYGSHYLATHHTAKIEKIYAADIDEESIVYAQAHYANPLIHFLVQDGLSFSPGLLLDAVISLETIEHLAQPQDFVLHLTAMLKPGGRFIASAPVTPSMDANPFHLQDFTPHSFRDLFRKAGLKEINSMQQVQPFHPFKLAGGKTNKSRALRKNLLGYYFKHPSKFLLRLRSLLTDGFQNKYLVIVFEKPQT